MGSDAKMLRGQLRNLFKEMQPTVFDEEAMKALNKRIDERLNQIEQYVKSAMTEMNERSKETQSYVVRNLALATVQAATPKVVDDSTS